MKRRNHTSDLNFETPVRSKQGDNGTIRYAPEISSWAATIKAPNDTIRFHLGKTNSEFVTAHALVARLETLGFTPTRRSSTDIAASVLDFENNMNNRVFHFTATPTSGAQSPKLHLITPRVVRGYFNAQPIPGHDGPGNDGSWRALAAELMMTTTLGTERGQAVSQRFASEVLSDAPQRLSLDTADLTRWATNGATPTIAIASPALDRIRDLQTPRREIARAPLNI